ncbi:MAG: glycosyltransferase [Silvibacterium sp.]
MKVLLISGSHPPEPCGVGDYTYRLWQSLLSEGVDVECLRHKRWRVHDIHTALDAVDKAKADIIHIQYPTVGYGRALGPQLLSCLRPCVVTIHEISQAHALRKLSLYGFLGTAKMLIFTNTFERQAAMKLAPWIHRKSNIIPIGTNILTSPSSIGNTSKTIGYFGLIRPHKGLEEIIALAKLALNVNRDFKILIVGLEVHGQSDYYKMLRQQSVGLPVEWRAGLQGQDLNAALAECRIAYLPFPDGASERRSSLLTFLSRGTPVITTTGSQVTEDLKSVVQFAASPQEACSVAEKLFVDDGAWNDLHEKGLAYAKRISWNSIAQRHIQIYQRLMLGAVANTPVRS